jgi:hypothetical protein
MRNCELDSIGPDMDGNWLSDGACEYENELRNSIKPWNFTTSGTIINFKKRTLHRIQLGYFVHIFLVLPYVSVFGVKPMEKFRGFTRVCIPLGPTAETEISIMNMPISPLMSIWNSCKDLYICKCCLTLPYCELNALSKNLPSSEK